MKKYEIILNGLKNKSPLPLLYDQGYTPDKIKYEIIQELAPFFKNKDSLEKYSINFLVSDWINLLRIKTIYPSILDNIRSLVSIYNSAISANKHKTIETITTIMSREIDSANRFWSFVNLEVDKSTLEFEEFVQTAMKDISDIIEGIAKILLLEQIAIHRIIRNKDFEIEGLFKLKLGNIVSELIDNSNQAQLFKTYPDNIKISDWRNIAAHHDYIFRNGQVVCEYGPVGKRQTLSLNREELFEKVKQCARTLEALNLAHKFFTFDNLDIISEKQPKMRSDARGEIGFLMFASSITSQGFEIVNIDYEKDKEAVLTVRDLTQEDPIKHGIHSSQFVYPLWVESESKKMTVKYQTNKKMLFLTASINDEVCKKILTGEKKFEYLAEKIELIKNENSG